MRFGSYSVLIPEGRESGEGYVGLPHGGQYALRLGNHDGRRCLATVRLDGKEIGTFVLYGHETCTIERAPGDTGRFTFYADGTADAEAAGSAAIAGPNRGLVQVEFTPEKRQQAVRPANVGVVRSMSAFGPTTRRYQSDQHESYCAGTGGERTSGGITGLSGHSNQQFVSAAGFPLDESGRVTISLRLTLWNDGPRPLTAAGGAGNTIPAPVAA